MTKREEREIEGGRGRRREERDNRRDMRDLSTDEHCNSWKKLFHNQETDRRASLLVVPSLSLILSAFDWTVGRLEFGRTHFGAQKWNSVHAQQGHRALNHNRRGRERASSSVLGRWKFGQSRLAKQNQGCSNDEDEQRIAL